MNTAKRSDAGKSPKRLFLVKISDMFIQVRSGKEPPKLVRTLARPKFPVVKLYDSHWRVKTVPVVISNVVHEGGTILKTFKIREIERVYGAGAFNPKLKKWEVREITALDYSRLKEAERIIQNRR